MIACAFRQTLYSCQRFANSLTMLHFAETDTYHFRLAMDRLISVQWQSAHSLTQWKVCLAHSIAKIRVFLVLLQFLVNLEVEKVYFCKKLNLNQRINGVQPSNKIVIIIIINSKKSFKHLNFLKRESLNLKIISSPKIWPKKQQLLTFLKLRVVSR